MRVYFFGCASVLLLGSLGCADDPAPAPRAAIRVQVQALGVQPAGTGCQSSGNISIGKVPPTGNTAPGEPIRHGEGGASIRCSVKGSGTFTITVDAEDEEDGFTLDATVPEGGKGTGNVSLFNGAFGDRVNDQPCELAVDVPNLHVGPGAMFARLTCPLVTDPRSKSITTCQATGHVNIENCSD